MIILSFHTFEARKRIKLDEFNLLKNQLFIYCKKHKIRFYLEKSNELEFTSNFEMEKLKDDSFKKNSIRKDVWICDALINKGIIIKFAQIICSDSEGNPLSWYNGIWYVVNPRRVINDNEYVGIFDAKDVEKMLELANRLLKGVVYSMPSLDECILARLDFCQNINLENQDMVEMYIDLVKRCNIPPGFKMERFYDRKVRKVVNSKDGIKLSMGYMALIIYNKKAQMLKQDYDYPNIDAADGILRFEIQASYNKLYTLGINKGIKALRDFLNHGDEFAKQQFHYYLPKIFCTGDYYSYEVAEKKIKQSGYTNKIQKAMLDLLKMTSVHKSIYKAIMEMISNNYSKSQISLLLKKFNDLNLNLCTLPRRWQVENGLPNPIKLLSFS